MNRDQIHDLAREFIRADSAVAFSGAGLSTASGIPDFRGNEGLWSKYDPQMFSIHSLRADPEKFWEQYRQLHEEIVEGSDFQPNPAHEALSGLVDSGVLDAIITQNVDGLQEEAGVDSETLFKLHGDAQKITCMDCGLSLEIEPGSPRILDTEPPPTCDNCGGTLKPGSVLFGERLPLGVLEQSKSHAKESDVFLVVGSSLTVEPAASLPEHALNHGSSLAIVNLQSTGLDSRADFLFNEDVTEVLPALAKSIREISME